MLDDTDMPETTPLPVVESYTNITASPAETPISVNCRGARPASAPPPTDTVCAHEGTAQQQEQEQEREGGFSVGTSHAQALACV